MLTLKGWKYYKGCVLGVRSSTWAAVAVQGFANRFVPYDTWAKDLQYQRVLLLLVAPDADLARRTLGRLVEMAGQLNAQGTAKLLRLAGLPGTQNRRVADAQQAWTAAQTLGLPTVVKPNDLDRGEGVFTNYSVRSPNSLEQALRAGFSTPPWKYVCRCCRNPRQN